MYMPPYHSPLPGTLGGGGVPLSKSRSIKFLNASPRLPSSPRLRHSAVRLTRSRAPPPGYMAADEVAAAAAAAVPGPAPDTALQAPRAPPYGGRVRAPPYMASLIPITVPVPLKGRPQY